MKDHDPEELVDKINQLAAESRAKGITVNASSSEEYQKTSEEYDIKITLQFVMPSLETKAKYLVERRNVYSRLMREMNKSTTAEVTLTGERKDITFSLYLPEYQGDTLAHYRQNIWRATINGIIYSKSLLSPVVDEKAKEAIRRCHTITRDYLDSQVPEVMALALSKIGPRQKGIDALLGELEAYKQKR